MIDLHNGDCLEVMKDIPNGSIDAIITDPPYAITACKWDCVIPFDKMWEQLNRIIKPNGVIVLFGSEPFSSALRMSNIKNYKYDWVWEKTKAGTGLHAKYMPLKHHEIVSIFYKTKPTYNPQMTWNGITDKRKTFNPSLNKKDSVFCAGAKRVAKKDNGYRYPKSIQKFNNSDKTKSLHPTQKPVALMEYLIKTYTNENETVLDFTMGSGTTGVACKNLNRNFIGIEQDEKYFKIAKDRIENTQNTKEVEENNKSKLNKFFN